MQIAFECKTNKDYMMINTAIFHLKDGGELTIDRDSTEWSIDNDGNMEVIFKNIYFWAINDYHVFADGDGYSFYPTEEEEVKKLLSGDVTVTLELEDDADEDYEVEVINYYVS